MKYEVQKFLPVIYNLLLISSKVTILVCNCCLRVRFEPKQETQEDGETLKTHFMFRFLVLFSPGRTKVSSVIPSMMV